ncbi:hypothetical protein OUZ56_013275 [Daphnia magna]|uniref:Uncharacterized protein n=1 Tax=Daphnia magna TaxID=35525 RepID=A0ABQ9Z5D8_9CRUS|nr:hypothetical protein OUZ56_013275 [Daphnia magna]
MVTAARQDFFPGYKLSTEDSPDVKDLSNFASILRHAIYMVCTSFLDDESKTKVLKDIIQMSQQLEVRQEFGKSRQNMLALLKIFLDDSTCDKMDFLTKLAQVKLGTVGAYSRSQRKLVTQGKVIYVGQGIWTGKLDDTRFSVTVNSSNNSDPVSFIESIQVSDKHSVRHVLRFLEHWCQEMHVTNSIYSRGYLKNLFVIGRSFNCRLENQTSTSGCPIYLDVETKYLFDVMETKSINFQFNGRTLNLVSTHSRVGLPDANLNIFSYTPNMNDMNLHLQGLKPFLKKTIVHKFPLLVEWISNSVADAGLARKIAFDIQKTRPIPGWDMGKAMNWFRKSFITTLSSMGVRTCNEESAAIPSSPLKQKFDFNNPVLASVLNLSQFSFESHASMFKASTSIPHVESLNVQGPLLNLIDHDFLEEYNMDLFSSPCYEYMIDRDSTMDVTSVSNLIKNLQLFYHIR